METSFLNQHRCICGKLLLKGIFFDGLAEIKCRSCGKINNIGFIKMEDNNSHYMLIINDKCLISNCSNYACNILGYSNNELIGKSFTSIDPNLSKSCGEKIFGPESVLNEDNYLQIDTSHQSKSGKIISVSVLLKLYKPNKKNRYVLLLAEVKNNNFNKTKEDMFVDKACDFYFEIDKDGITTYVSPSMDGIFGINHNTLVGKQHFDIFSIRRKIDAIKGFLFFSSKEQPYRIVDNALEVNGDLIKYESYYAPIFNDSGKFIGYRVLGWLTPKTV